MKRKKKLRKVSVGPPKGTRTFEVVYVKAGNDLTATLDDTEAANFLDVQGFEVPKVRPPNVPTITTVGFKADFHFIVELPPSPSPIGPFIVYRVATHSRRIIEEGNLMEVPTPDNNGGILMGGHGREINNWQFFLQETNVS